MLVDELSKNMQMGKQTDLILLNFSKAFDKVAQEKLLQKLHFNVIRGDTLKWIKGFLDKRKLSFVINGISSDSISVSSGVPQGFVLGPILFVAYINDLPGQVRSRVRLFADDTAMHLAISSLSDANILQDDLSKLEHWEKSWNMNFSPAKRQVLHVTRSKTPTPSKYFLHNTELESAAAAKYLGVTISDDLSWGNYVNNTAYLQKKQIKRWDFSSGILKYTNRTWNPQLIRHLYAHS